MLLSVLVISALYFGLIMLVLWESTVRYRAAQAFRARVVAQTLAENAAELAARRIATGSSGRVEEEIDGGIMAGEATVTGSSGDGSFHIRAAGRASGAHSAEASVEVWGRIVQGRLVIDRTRHSQ